ncbi:MAG: hypothetical protein V9G22_15785 [Ottowia sp.]
MAVDVPEVDDDPPPAPLAFVLARASMGRSLRAPHPWTTALAATNERAFPSLLDESGPDTIDDRSRARLRWPQSSR